VREWISEARTLTLWVVKALPTIFTHSRRALEGCLKIEESSIKKVAYMRI